MPAASSPRPLVVQYLYVHDPGEAFHYPTSRSAQSPATVAARYLECALTQAATLRLRDVECDLALATNIIDRRVTGATGERLLDAIEALDVQLLSAEYKHRPAGEHPNYVSSRYLLDAIVAATAAQADERLLYFSDLDCVWPDAERVFAATPAAPAVGCIWIPYPPDWDAVSFGERFVSRGAIGELARTMGGSADVPPWVGGELLAGNARTLRALVATCEELDDRLADMREALPAEEQILTLACALGRTRFENMSAVARRIHTGSRHNAPRVERPLDYGFWHLPSEKGLSLRRTAHQILRGHERPLRRDLADSKRTARRFNVAGTGALRRMRDDGWIATQRVRSLSLW